MVHTDHPDEKSVMTYVSSLYEIFPKEPTVQEALHDNVSVYIGIKKKSQDLSISTPYSIPVTFNAIVCYRIKNHETVHAL